MKTKTSPPQWTAPLLALALGFAPYALADTAGHVQTVVGNAKVYDAAGKERDIKRGDVIRQGDRIVTADQSLVQVKFVDGAYVSVRNETDVAIEQYRHDEKAPKESGAILKLAKGALRSISGLIGAANPDGYRVITPTATIGIRGTDHEPVFIPEPKPGEVARGTPGTYDKVNSGATVIRAATGEISIRPGQTGFVPAVVTTAPTVLPRTPDFFKNLDPSKDKGDKSASNRGEQGRANAAIASDGRSEQRGESGKDGDQRGDSKDKGEKLIGSRGELGRANAAIASDGRSEQRGESGKAGELSGTSGLNTRLMTGTLGTAGISGMSGSLGVTGDSSRVTGDSSRATGDSSRATSDSSRATGDSSRVTSDSSRVTGDSSRTAVRSGDAVRTITGTASPTTSSPTTSIRTTPPPPTTTTTTTIRR